MQLLQLDVPQGRYRWRMRWLRRDRHHQRTPRYRPPRRRCRGLISALREGKSTSVDKTSGGCEHLLAEGGVQQGPPFGPPWFLTRRSHSCEMAASLPGLPILPEALGTISGSTQLTAGLHIPDTHGAIRAGRRELLT